MSDTAMTWIEYVVVPGGVQILGSIALALIERSRLKKEGKADPNRFTVKLPVAYVISLLAAFIVFTTITVFFNNQVSRDSSVNLFTRVILNVCMIGLAVASLLYFYIYLRRKIEVVGDTAKVTPAFSKSYTFTVRDVTDVIYYDKEITVKVSGKKVKVYKICHCSGLFGQWLGW